MSSPLGGEEEARRAHEQLQRQIQLTTVSHVNQNSEEGTERPSSSASSTGLRWFLGPSFLRQYEETREVYLRSTRLPNSREGLLVDPGAFDNLVGQRWVERMIALGYQHHFRAIKPIGVEGVGAEAQSASELVTMNGSVRIMDGDVQPATYQAPMIPNSEVPALWGHKSLAQHRTVLDMVNRKLYMCGPGEIKFVPPPGTAIIKLELTTSGHLIMPFTEKANAKDKQSKDKLRLSFSTRLQDEASLPSADGSSPNA